MTGTETQILRIVAEEQGHADMASVAHSMGVSADYVAGIMQGLAEGDYLKEAKGGGYAITTKGKQALSPFAGRSGGRVVASGFP